MMMKTVEEAHQAVKEGSMSLEDFKAWLALWSIKVAGLYA